MRHLLTGLALLGAGCLDLSGKDDTGDDGGDGSDTLMDPAACASGQILVPTDESFLCSDGCNTCSCDVYDGEASFLTTDMYCYDAPPPEGCVTEYVVVEYGSSYPSIDGCNTCTCGEDGLLSCTEMGCP